MLTVTESPETCAPKIVDSLMPTSASSGSALPSVVPARMPESSSLTLASSELLSDASPLPRSVSQPSVAIPANPPAWLFVALTVTLPVPGAETPSTTGTFTLSSTMWAAARPPANPPAYRSTAVTFNAPSADTPDPWTSVWGVLSQSSSCASFEGSSVPWISPLRARPTKPPA